MTEKIEVKPLRKSRGGIFPGIFSGVFPVAALRRKEGGE